MTDLTQSDYDRVRTDFATTLIEALIQDSRRVDTTTIQEEVPPHLGPSWDDYFAAYDAEALATIADSPRFDPEQDIELARDAGDIVHQVAYNAVRVDIEQYLYDFIDDINAAILIHDVLDDLEDSDLTPSDVVDGFFTWIGENRDMLNEDITGLGLEDFNETHVRRIEVLNPITDNTLIDALWEYLNEIYGPTVDAHQP